MRAAGRCVIPFFPSPGRPIEARFGMQAAFALAAQASRIAVSRCARPGGSHSLRFNPLPPTVGGRNS